MLSGLVSAIVFSVVILKLILSNTCAKMQE